MELCQPIIKNCKLVLLNWRKEPVSSYDLVRGENSVLDLEDGVLDLVLGHKNKHLLGLENVAWLGVCHEGSIKPIKLISLNRDSILYGWNSEKIHFENLIFDKVESLLRIMLKNDIKLSKEGLANERNTFLNSIISDGVTYESTPISNLYTTLRTKEFYYEDYTPFHEFFNHKSVIGRGEGIREGKRLSDERATNLLTLYINNAYRLDSVLVREVI